MNPPQVSIIVPVYNPGERLLTACIESVLAQTAPGFELILVNDASTDTSPEVCRRFAAADPRIRLIDLPRNQGVSYARNCGISHATGTFICFLDADDRLLPSMLQRLLAIAASHPEADIIACGMQRVAPGEPVSDHAGHSLPQILRPAEAVEQALYQQGGINNSPCGKLYRREICTIAPFPPGRYEDLRVFHRHFLRARSIAAIPDPLYLYTNNPASYINTFNLGRTVVLDVVTEIVDYMQANLPQLLPAARDRALSAAFNMLTLLARHHIPAPETRERCRAIIRAYRRQSLLNPKVRLKNKLGIIASYLGLLRII